MIVQSSHLQERIFKMESMQKCFILQSVHFAHLHDHFLFIDIAAEYRNHFILRFSVSLEISLLLPLAIHETVLAGFLMKSLSIVES